jgi:lipopolysaccharide biosynthesis protein
MACAMSSEEVDLIRNKYAYTPEEFDYICQRQDFKREYAEWTQRLITEGNSFKLKLRAMSEAFLPQLHEILTSENTAPSVKVDTFKYITKVAGLEPLPEKVQSDDKKQVTRFVIQWQDGTGQAAIEVKSE